MNLTIHPRRKYSTKGNLLHSSIPLVAENITLPIYYYNVMLATNRSGRIKRTKVLQYSMFDVDGCSMQQAGKKLGEVASNLTVASSAR